MTGKYSKINKINIIFWVLIIIPFFLIPPYLIMLISLAQSSDVFSFPPRWIVNSFTLDAYRKILTSQPFQSFIRSILVASICVVGTLVMAVPAAYSLSRMKPRIKYILLISVFIIRMIPGITIALPITIEFLRLGLLDSIMGLAMAHLIHILPFSLWILVSVFETIPFELEEAAFIDGASRLQALMYTILPVSMVGVSVACIFSFLQSWHEFTYALYLSLMRPTLPVTVWIFSSRGYVQESAAYSVLLTLPVILITYLLQKYLKAGYLSGSIKG
jgi:trehalose transport system permease protein